MTGPGALEIERLTEPRPADLDAILALEGASVRRPSTREALAATVGDPTARIYVARLPTRGIVAFCACWLVADELHINTVAVREELRRQGIASRLMRYVFENSGAASATLEVRRSNLAALKLYTGLGFVESAVRPNYYSDPEEDALILWRHP